MNTSPYPSTMSLYQQVIHQTRYARWNDEDKRREHWHESVKRYVDYFVDFLKKNHNYTVPRKTQEKVYDAIYNLEVMPSMRTLMTAGAALDSAQMANYNCLTADTKVLTREYGLVPIGELAGTSVHVLNSLHQWELAPVRTFGKQYVKRITLKKKRARTNVTEVYATGSHRWKLLDGTFVTTDDLLTGARIPCVYADKPDIEGSIDYQRGVVHGLVYGDGTKITRRPNGVPETVRSIRTDPGYKIRICGDHDDILPYFTQLGYKPSYYEYMNGDPIVELLDSFAKVTGMKDLPDEFSSQNYVLGFIRGWLAADGSVNNGITTLCTHLDGLEWLRKMAPVAGFGIGAARKFPDETNFGRRTRDTFSVTLSKGSVTEADLLIKRKRNNLTHSVEDYWVVQSVEETDRFEEVYCATVASTSDFVIEGSILTGNCTYNVINSTRSFSEHMYVLMCGAGSGFSVERQFTEQLPYIPHELVPTDTTIVVADSRKGWCVAYQQLLNLLYAGSIPKYNTDAVRPEGARLKTFGGYSSGPKVLEELFDFTIRMFKENAGKRLRPVQVFSLLCFVAQIVVVGGVRRSATICLFDSDDFEMRRAKSGQWWVDNPHYAMANVSAVFDRRPDPVEFLEIWRDLVKSGSGEPGIFNRQAVWDHMEKHGRKTYDKKGNRIPIGVNPCSLPGDQMIMTENGPRRMSSLVGTAPKVLVHGKLYQASEFIKTGDKEVFDVTTREGFTFAGTDNHQFQLTSGEWKYIKDLRVGDKVKVHDHRGTESKHDQEMFDKGWILGEIVGDGGFNPEKYPTYVRFWGADREVLAPLAASIIKKHFSQRVEDAVDTDRTIITTNSRQMDTFAAAYIEPLTKEAKPELEEADESFVRGFVSGYFDADGTVLHNIDKGISVRLASVSYKRLQAVQRMLARCGVYSKIYTNRNASSAGEGLLPNGKGGKAYYPIKPTHELVVARDSLQVFANVVGFRGDKQVVLLNALSRYNRNLYKARYQAEITSIALRGVEPVYDAEVEEVKCFDANGVVAHNSEILLRPMQPCNLTGIAIRPDDTLQSLLRKQEIATIIGTWQTCVSDFEYLRKAWKDNVEEERLLGVCLSGVMDHTVLKEVSATSKQWLNALEQKVWDVNKKLAKEIGINPAASVTALKPAGNSGELYDTASGIHPRYASHYIRTIRQSAGDPMTRFLVDNGIPNEVSKQNSRDVVFSFPMKSPEDALIAPQLSAMQQLEHWLHVKNGYATHTVSCTIYVKRHEWLEVGEWVYRHFDDITGLSFLPYDDHVYEQAPYQPIDAEAYEARLSELPTSIDWNLLKHYESTDNTAVSQEFACVGGACELK